MGSLTLSEAWMGGVRWGSERRGGEEGETEVSHQDIFFLLLFPHIYKSIFSLFLL